MLDALTDRESDRLWWRIIRAMAAVADEIECLSLAPAAVRDELYGAGCLQSYRAMAAELAELATDDIRRTVSSWAILLDEIPEEGSEQCQGSESQSQISPARKLPQSMPVLAANCPGRNRTTTLRSYLSRYLRPCWTRWRKSPRPRRAG